MEIVLMDFTGVYREQNFYREYPCQTIDLTCMEGVNCYCTPESEQTLSEAAERYCVRGIRFLDSGNFHYASKIWMEKMKEPFDLLLFDNHTDLQEPAFFGLLSCGSWVREALVQNLFLRRVCIVGPPKKDCRREIGDDRVAFVTGEDAARGDMGTFEEFLKDSDLPLYLSVDKDLLDKEEAVTNWDQGETDLETLKKWILEAAGERRCMGADICGENAAAGGVFDSDESHRNDRANKELLELFRRVFEGG